MVLDDLDALIASEAQGVLREKLPKTSSSSSPSSVLQTPDPRPKTSSSSSVLQTPDPNPLTQNPTYVRTYVRTYVGKLQKSKTEPPELEWTQAAGSAGLLAIREFRTRSRL